MKRLTVLLVLASVNAGAIAEDVAGVIDSGAHDAYRAHLVVVKDTREYMSYVVPHEGAGECLNANCMIEAKVAVGGEYVVRLGDTCLRESYYFVKRESFYFEGRLIPSIGASNHTFRCDAQGNAI